jgi:hypothetical protein
MANRKKKPRTSLIMFPTADGYMPIEQVSEEELNAYWERVKRDVSRVLSQMCGRK